MALVGFLALAIDLGMLAIAKTQVQQAADLAALTAVRTLNGNSTNNYNQSAATTNAQNVVTYNAILGQSIQVVATARSPTAPTTTTRPRSRFSANFPADERLSRRPRSRPRSPRTALPGAFSKIFGRRNSCPNVSATAQAVHRPRDIALVMDLSGSMRMGTCLGFDFIPTSRTTNNPDTPRTDVRPLFVEQRRPAGAEHQSNLSRRQLHDLSEQYDRCELARIP